MGNKGRAALFFIFVFALMLIFLIYLMNSMTLVRQVAVVDSVQGTVKVLVDGKDQPVTPKVGRLVKAGDVIQTGPNASIEIRWVRWAGGMRIKIGPNTKFTVKRAKLNTATKESDSLMRVDVGKVWVRLRQSLTGKSKFEVETPTVVAAIRGTIFSVAVEKDGASRVEVLEGRVALTPTTGGAREVVEPGESSLVVSGAATNIRPLTTAELADWQGQTAIVGPFLVVNTPAEGAKVSGATCLVTGRTEQGVMLYVDKSLVTLEKKNHFSYEAPLEPGATAVTIRARDEQGRETNIVRNIVRENAPAPAEADNTTSASDEPAPAEPDSVVPAPTAVEQTPTTDN